MLRTSKWNFYSSLNWNFLKEMLAITSLVMESGSGYSEVCYNIRTVSLSFFLKDTLHTLHCFNAVYLMTLAAQGTVSNGTIWSGPNWRHHHGTCLEDWGKWQNFSWDSQVSQSRLKPSTYQIYNRSITVWATSLSLYNLNDLSNKGVTYCIHEISRTATYSCLSRHHILLWYS